MKILLSFVLFCVCTNANPLPKVNLTQEEYFITLQAMQRKGLMHCISTFKSDDKILQGMALAKQGIYIEDGFERALYTQNPKLLNMKNAWNVDKISGVIFEYIRRYVELNIPLVAYTADNATDYLNSIFEKPITKIPNYFIPCMQMYDSIEYKSYLDKVVNFVICKNCQNYMVKNSQDSAKDCNEIVSIAKMQGFGRCVAYQQGGYDKVPRDIQSGYFLLSHFAAVHHHKYDKDKITQELDLYIHNTIKTNKNQSILQCLQMYDSQEYDDEIKRIVKKYCKDCK